MAGSITEEDRRAVRKIYRKMARGLEAELARLPITENMAKVLIAQNALRACMEVVLSEMLPYDQQDLAELAVRLAAYAISAAPIEDHESLIAGVLAALPVTVSYKVKTGAVIRATWETAGVQHPNIPTPSEAN